MKTETDSEVIIDKKIIGSVIKAFLLTLIFSINIRTLNTETFSIVTILPEYGFSQWIIVLGISFVIYFSRFKCINAKSYHPKRLVCLSLIFGILNTMGLFMYYNDCLPRTAEAYVLFLLYILCYSYVFLLVSRCFLRGLEICKFKQEKHYLACNYKLPHFLHNNIFWVSFAVILLCWFPWILTYYPASMEWDVYYPLMQYLCQTPPNNHHPWFYTCIIGFFYSIGLFFNNKNLGILGDLI